eukprot:Pgem_evm1s1906
MFTIQSMITTLCVFTTQTNVALSATIPRNFNIDNNNKSNTGVDLSQIYQALSLASAAYCPAEKLFPTTNFANFDENGKVINGTKNDFHIDYKTGQSNIVGFVAVSPERKQIWLVFRGTQMGSMDNWIQNIKLDLVDANITRYSNIKMHRGFLESWGYLKEDLLPKFLQYKKQYPDFKLGVTGHSLGGALSTVAAVDLLVNHDVLVDQFITFGQPRVGNGYFAQWFEQKFTKNIPVRRVVHAKDVVAHLPPNPFPNITSSKLYKHFGAEYWQVDNDLKNNRICMGGEDYECSDSVDPSEYSVTDHLTYLNVALGDLQHC